MMALGGETRTRNFLPRQTSLLRAEEKKRKVDYESQGLHVENP
jgi:hypothetical protein